MNTPKKITLVLLLTLFFLPLQLFSANNLKIIHRPQVKWNLEGTGYYNFDTSSGFGQLIDEINGSFSIRHPPNTESEYFLTFSSNSSDSQSKALKKGNEQLLYQFYKNNNKDESLGSQISVDGTKILSGMITRSDKGFLVPLSYYFYIEPNQLVSSGTYTDQVTLRLYQGAPGKTYSLVDTQKVTYTVDVPAQVKLSIDGYTQDSYLIDFGELQSFEQQSFSIEITSNTKYRLKIKSKNKGTLKNESRATPSSNKSNFLSYQLLFDNSQVDLSKNSYKNMMEIPTDPNRFHRSFPVKIVIGDVKNKNAGTYSDTVHLVVQNVH